MAGGSVDLEELDLTAYAQDAWTADADFFAQQVGTRQREFPDQGVFRTGGGACQR